MWPPSRRLRRGRRRMRRIRWMHGRRARIVLRVITAALAVFVLITGWSIGHALSVPGGGTFSQRVAEWARNHSLGPVVTFGEWLTYSGPKKGGNPGVSFDKLGGKGGPKRRHYHGLQPTIPPNM